MAPRVQAGGGSLGDLRRAQPDATLSNLLEALGDELRLLGRLALFEYEARREGHPVSADAFRDLAEVQRESFDVLVRCLKRYLDEAPSAPRRELGSDLGREAAP